MEEPEKYVLMFDEDKCLREMARLRALQDRILEICKGVWPSVLSDEAIWHEAGPEYSGDDIAGSLRVLVQVGLLQPVTGRDMPYYLLTNWNN